MTEPIRSCIGCGRKAPQGQLLRFAALDGQLVPGAGMPGRGAYTCRRLACFERAVSLSQATQDEIRALDQALYLQVFVTPT